ncbi:hypothetical protein LCGC14_2972840, partial [marine sediment metagenome]
DVLEIGPGPGGLTRGLLAEGARRVLAVEKDARCMPALAEIAAAYSGRLEVVNADALALDVTSRLDAPIRVVANLPYNVGTELLTRWLDPGHWPPFWDSLTLMFQREVAERIVATPGSKSYGRLAILSQWRSDPRIVMELPPEAFSPPPKVHSAVVHLTRLAEPRFPAEPRVLFRVVAAGFNQRRKMLRASLKGLAPDIEQRLERAGIKPTQRAEELSLPQFCALARDAELLGERWTLLIIRELLLGPKRYTDLRERLDGVSTSVLAERLSRLEDAGLIRRTSLEPPAASIVYELTQDGRALRPAVFALIRWGGRYLMPQRPGERVEPDWLRLAMSAYIPKGPTPERSFNIHIPADGSEAVIHVRGGPDGT